MENIEFKANTKPGSRLSFFSKLPKFTKSPKILIYALLLISLPTSVLLVKTVQDIRQRASSLPATPPTPPVPPVKYIFSQSAQLSPDPIPHYFVIAPNPLLDLTGDLTIEAWIKPNAPANPQETQYSDIVTKHDGDGNAYGLQYTSFKEPDGTYSYSYNFSIADKKINCGQVTLYTANVQSKIGYHVDEQTLTKWKHIAAVKKGNTLYVFENGILVANRTDWTFQSPCIQPNNPISIGARLTGDGQYQDSFFYGEIDEIRISNIARYTSDFPTQPEPFKTDSSTVALYHLDGNIGYLNDASGNRLDGKIYGNIQYPNSTILVIGPTPPLLTPTKAPTSCSTCAGTDKPYLCLSGSPAAFCNTTPTSGDIVCTPCSATPTPPPYTPTPSVGLPTPCGQYGDITGDYLVTSTDKSEILRIMAGFTYKDWQIKNADVDGDGKVTLSDALIVERYLAKLESTFPVCRIASPTPPVGTPIPTIKLSPTPTPVAPLYCGAPCTTNTQCSTAGLCNVCVRGVCAKAPTSTPRPTTYATPTPAKCEPTRSICASGNRLQTYRMDSNCTTATLVSSVTCKTSCVKISSSKAQCAESITPTPTPTPKMCPATVSSTSYTRSCRYQLFRSGYRTVSYRCSDGYRGTINSNSCTSSSNLSSQVKTACAKRLSICR